MSEKTVLIVGGGIAGLSATNQPAYLKIGSILVERQSTVDGERGGRHGKQLIIKKRAINKIDFGA